MSFGRQEPRIKAPYKTPAMHPGVVFRMAEPIAGEPRIAPVAKRQPAKRAEPGPAIRESARGEECTVRLPGCQGNPAATIWSHFRGAAGGKGRSIKALDVCGAYACCYCDAVYDGQTPRPLGWTKEDVDAAWHEGHMRSLVKLNEKGLL